MTGVTYDTCYIYSELNILASVDQKLLLKTPTGGRACVGREDLQLVTVSSVELLYKNTIIKSFCDYLYMIVLFLFRSTLLIHFPHHLLVCIFAYSLL